nr:MAG TPA: hypothetical protein [Caudoviricetes sp.]
MTFIWSASLLINATFIKKESRTIYSLFYFILKEGF